MVPLMARRRASVGCAVRTGRNSSSPSRRSASSRPDLLGELRERRRDRVVQDGRSGGRLGLPVAQHAHAVVLLGEVREVEVAGERTGDLFGALHGEGGHDVCGLVQRVGRRVAVGPDGQLAETFDVVQQVLAPVLAEDPAEKSAEQAHVLAQRVRYLVPGVAANGLS